MSKNELSETSQQIKIVQQFFEMLNQNDLASITKDFDPHIERIEPPGFPSSGTYRGIPEVLAQILPARGKWAEGSCEPERIFQNGDKVIALVHVRVRLKDREEWNEGRIADAFQFRDGKITHWQTYINREEALTWAGIAAAETTA